MKSASSGCFSNISLLQLHEDLTSSLMKSVGNVSPLGLGAFS